MCSPSVLVDPCVRAAYHTVLQLKAACLSVMTICLCRQSKSPADVLYHFCFEPHQQIHTSVRVEAERLDLEGSSCRKWPPDCVSVNRPGQVVLTVCKQRLLCLMTALSSPRCTRRFKSAWLKLAWQSTHAISRRNSGLVLEFRSWTRPWAAPATASTSLTCAKHRLGNCAPTLQIQRRCQKALLLYSPAECQWHDATSRLLVVSRDGSTAQHHRLTAVLLS